MTAVPSGVLLERVSRTLEENPRVSKSRLWRLVRKGNKQSIMRATDILIDQGYVQTTPAERASVLTSVRPYRCDPGSKEPVFEEPAADPPVNQLVSGGEEPHKNHGGGWQTSDARPGKDGKTRVSATEAKNGNGSSGELVVRTEPRCKVCREPGLRQEVNSMIARGFSLAAILTHIAAVNEKLPEKSRITDDSLQRHRSRHFSFQDPAAAIWREIIEENAAAESADLQRGVTSLVTCMGYLGVMKNKGFANLVAEETVVSVDQGAWAARELHKMTRDGGDDAQRWAEVHAKQAKIVAVFREFIPPERHQEFLDRLEGRTSPPPGGARPPAAGGDRGDDGDAFDPLEGDDSDED